MRDAALALGIPAGAQLRLVELPPAAPAILAGVRLASLPLILEGAVPAALLAIAVERVFALDERVVVSPGLRLP